MLKRASVFLGKCFRRSRPLRVNNPSDQSTPIPPGGTYSKSSTPFRVLSIDGGGIRGILPASVLAELEHRSGRPIVDLFDLIVGTSTGGLLALALTIPERKAGRPKYTAKDIVQFYVKEGERIFTRSVWHQIRSVGSLAEGKYPATGIEEVLQEYFGEVRLKDTLGNVMVPAYEIERRIPFLFRSWAAREEEENDFKVRDIVRSATAAPTYFEPARIQAHQSSDYFTFVDGALFAYNPAMCAFVEAMEQGKNHKEILMVSLGTGELTQRLPYEEVKEWGAAKWAQPIFSLMCDGSCDIVDYQMRRALPELVEKRYFRFQTVLEPGNEDLDNASKSNIRILRLLSEDLVSSNANTLTQLANKLAAGAPPNSRSSDVMFERGYSEEQRNEHLAAPKSRISGSPDEFGS